MPVRKEAPPRTYRVALWLLAAGLIGCNGVIGTSDEPGGATSGGARPGHRGRRERRRGPRLVRRAASSIPAPHFLRRLTNQEYQATVRMLLGDGIDEVSADFPPNLSAKGFSNNSESIPISSLHVERYEEAAEQLAMQLVSDPARRARVIGCDPASGGTTCLTSFIAAFGQRAFRRPLRLEETQAFVALAQQAAGNPRFVRRREARHRSSPPIAELSLSRRGRSS